MKFNIDKLLPWKKGKNEKSLKEIQETKKPYSKTSSKKKFATLQPLDLRQAVLIWLAKQKPTGIGIYVPTRFSMFKADVAAFWSKPGKKNIYTPIKTVAVEIRFDREECWPDFSKQQELLKELVREKELKRKLEEIVRVEEPELKDNDVLFNEYESWKYKDSKNTKYQKCLKNIEKIEHSIYKGSRFERIRRAHVADNLYIAVPEAVIDPDELADGWGLLYICKNHSVKIAKLPDEKDCSVENRLHLAQTISASATKYVLYSQGINMSSRGGYFITAPPHRRHKTPDRMES